MRKTLAALAALTILAALGGCATADFQPYEGKANVHEGQGGTKVVVDGIDFWANGTPPRKYEIVGVIQSAIGDGWGAMHAIRSAVATKAHAVGANAVIEMSSSSSLGGMYQVSAGVVAAVNQRTVNFEAIRYLPPTN